MQYVYILYSSILKKLYIGTTHDLKQRINQHNKGQSRYTKRANDWKLLHYQAFANKTDTLREEKFLKTGQGKIRIERLLQETLKIEIGGVA